MYCQHIIFVLLHCTQAFYYTDNKYTNNIQKIVNKDNFKASDGYLDKFLKKVPHLFINNWQILSCNMSCNSTVLKFEKKKFEELGLTVDQMYNDDESSLFWIYYTIKNFFIISKCSRTKMAKEQITFMSYANA